VAAIGSDRIRTGIRETLSQEQRRHREAPGSVGGGIVIAGMARGSRPHSRSAGAESVMCSTGCWRSRVAGTRGGAATRVCL
jgi:hypothetical protein